MNMPVLKTETATAMPRRAAGATVVRAASRRTPASSSPRCCRRCGIAAARPAAARDARAAPAGLADPVQRPGATLPAPTQDLDRGQGSDRRSVLRRRPAGHRARLARADLAAARAIGYGLAGVIGIALGAIIGQSVWAMRGLDPIFQVLRTDAAAGLAADLARGVPRQPAVGDLRDLHHLDLADHHQHRGRHPQHPAGLPQRRAGAAAEPARVLLQDHDPVGRALHLHRAAHRHRPVVAGHRRGRDADRRRRHRLLHLGRVELLAPLRHHRGAGLHRRRRLRARPPRRARSPPSSRAAPQPTEGARSP